MALAHDPEGNFDIAALVAKARAWRGLVGLDLARDVTCAQSYRWNEMRWAWPQGYQPRQGAGLRVVAIDYGAKRNILRCLAAAGCDVIVVPATATAEDIRAKLKTVLQMAIVLTYGASLPVVTVDTAASGTGTARA